MDSASLISTWASNRSMSSTGNGYAAFCFLVFFVVITSVMEFPFRYYFMTPLHTKNLTGSVPILVRRVKYLNNIVEQDRRAIKSVTRPMLD
jgi:hypothetical protein